jgi:hypothetical protein
MRVSRGGHSPPREHRAAQRHDVHAAPAFLTALGAAPMLAYSSDNRSGARLQGLTLAATQRLLIQFQEQPPRARQVVERGQGEAL